MNVLDELPCAVVITDRVGCVLGVNAGLAELVGAPRDGLMGGSIEDLMPPASRIFLQTHLWPTLLRDGRLTEIHLQIKGDGNRRLPVLLNARRGEHEGALAYFWTLFSAVDRHRFEAELVEQRNLADSRNQALLENQRFIKGVTDAIPGLVAYWDKGLRCRFANRAYLEWFGRDPDQLIGTSLRDLLGDSVFARNEAHIQGALAGQEQVFERTLVKADGSIGHTLAHYLPDVVEGEVQGFFVLVNDVTALKESQVVLEEAQRLGQIGSWTWRVEGDVVSWSPQLFAIFGRDPAGSAPSFIEQSALYLAEDFDQLRRQVESALLSGEPYEMELRYWRQDGSTGWVEARGEVVRDSAERVTGLRGTVQEISLRKEQQQALLVTKGRLRSMYETTPALLHSIDAQGCLLHVSDAWLTRLPSWTNRKSSMRSHICCATRWA